MICQRPNMASHPTEASAGSSSASSASVASYGDHTQGPARKKMRKGTKSCLECRRRKIRCTPQPGGSSVCRECHARGSTCIDQEHGDPEAVDHAADPSYNLRERVSQLEALVKDALARRSEDNSENAAIHPSTAAETRTGRAAPFTCR